MICLIFCLNTSHFCVSKTVNVYLEPQRVLYGGTLSLAIFVFAIIIAECGI